ncbi:hypothetical protein D3C73_610290 [compost metagenome]
MRETIRHRRGKTNTLQEFTNTVTRIRRTHQTMGDHRLGDRLPDTNARVEAFERILKDHLCFAANVRQFRFSGFQHVLAIDPYFARHRIGEAND